MAQMFAHPEHLTPGEAYANVVTLLDGKGFLDTLAELDGHRFEGEIRVPVTIAWAPATACSCPTRRCGRGGCCRARGTCGCTGAGTCR